MTATGISKSQTRHFLKDTDLSPAEQAEVLELAVRLKAAPYSVQPFAADASSRKTVAIIFDKTSTRTRVSFATPVSEVPGSTGPGGVAVPVGVAAPAASVVWLWELRGWLPWSVAAAATPEWRRAAANSAIAARVVVRIR